MTHPAEAGFLRAIVENPHDDVARLVYADWLDDHGQEERAEFIRVQCELASPGVVDRVTGHWSESSREYAPGCRCRPCNLRRREQELLRTTHRGSNPPAYNWWGWAGPAQVLYQDGADYRDHFTYRRGFVEVIRCRLEDWIGRECERCAPAQHYPFRCGLCHGSGRVKALGPALVLACPLLRVEVSDRRPNGLPGTAIWSRADRADPRLGRHPEWWLPPFIFGALCKGEVRPPQPEHNLFCANEDAARDDLSQALLAWARGVAKLPALTSAPS